MGVAVGGVHRVLRSPLVVPRVSGAKLHGSPKEPRCPICPEDTSRSVGTYSVIVNNFQFNRRSVSRFCGCMSLRLGFHVPGAGGSCSELWAVRCSRVPLTYGG